MVDSAFVVVNGTKSAYTAVSPTVYTVLVTPTADGAVTIDVAGSVAQDTLLNNNTPAVQLSRTYDSTNPSVVLTTGAPNPTNGAFTVTATFSEAVTGMTLGDFVLSSNAGKTAFSGVSTTVYTMLVTPTMDGLVTIDLPIASAQDLATNNNSTATQLTRTYDSIVPTITISATPTSVNSGATSAITFTLSESSVNFGSGDVVVAGGTLSAFAGAGTAYTATFTPTPSSTANGTIDVAGSTFTDAAGNNNTLATQNVITVDTVVPTVVLTTAVSNPTNSASFTVTATFSEAVTGMLDSAFVVVNGTKSAYTAVSPTVYTVLVTPTADGAVTIDVAGSVAQDTLLNNNTPAVQLSRTYDGTAPVTSLVGSGSMTIAHGSVYVDPGATWTDALDGTGTIASASSGSVNTAILGVYTLEYRKIDNVGNTGAIVTRTVTVRDMTAPVVTLV
jgi:hypothetical protein